VRVWLTPSGSPPSDWSTTLGFDTIPDPASWASAQWIGGYNQLRSDLNVQCMMPIAGRKF
jgi:hypothetical protein